MKFNSTPAERLATLSRDLKKAKAGKAWALRQGFDQAHVAKVMDPPIAALEKLIASFR